MSERTTLEEKKRAGNKGPAERQSLLSHAERAEPLQRTIGNQAILRLMRSGNLRAKLTVSRPDDIYEQEADSVADEVMRMPEPQVQRQPKKEEEELLHRTHIGSTITPLSRKEAGEEEELLQKEERPDRVTETTHAIEANIDSLRGGGQPLADSTRAFMEPRFGADLGHVRVHTDTRAAETALNVNALAFTIGRDIVFGAGQYSPETPAGQRLVAHELTHVIQQEGIARKPDDQSGKEPGRAVTNVDPYERYIQRQQAPAAAAPQHQIVHDADFHQSLDGVALNASLLANVNSLSRHLIQNNLVNANITYNEGVRSPVVAHRWSTAWSIRNDRVPMANLQALQNGNDLDGNHWFTAGWTIDQAKQNASTIWSGAVAAEGYAADNPRRAPNTYQFVSNHCFGNAMDVAVPWTTGGGTDVAANAVVAQFNLTRPVAGERWHFEL
jgi:hypothetical protein